MSVGRLFPSSAWRITILGALLYFSFTFAWNALAAVIPAIVATLELSEFHTGVLLGTVALTIFVTWPIVAPLVEYVGADQAMGVGILIVGFSAIARGYVDSLVPLVLLMALLSLGGSTVTYGLPIVVSSWFPSNQAGT
ncbi:hypothetical protein, partial [Halorubrum luteum]